jgi:YcaO-like protein with predicted kinase domain
MTAADIGALLRGVARNIGVSRIADLTGLDITGVPVVQATRPASRSNLVSQGKGTTLEAAAASAILEAAEGFFSERPEQMPSCSATAAELGAPVQCFAAFLHDHDDGWALRKIKWAEAASLVTGAACHVPLGLVHSCFTAYPPEIGDIFQTTTTGLAAGFTQEAAVMHGLLECIERDGLARASQTPGILQATRIDDGLIINPQLSALLANLRGRGLLCGFWRAPSPSGVPVTWCQIMEDCETPQAILPLPSEGSAARLDEQEAMCAALLEAAQSRVTAISGARDDFTRANYPRRYNEAQLAAHRTLLKHGTHILRPRDKADISGMDGLLTQLDRSRLDDIRVVTFDTSSIPGIHVVKIIMPQLLCFMEGDAA